MELTVTDGGSRVCDPRTMLLREDAGLAPHTIRDRGKAAKTEWS